MNCKQGDLAVVVKTSRVNPKSLGMIVRCLRRGISGDYSQTPGLGRNEPTWIVEASRPTLVQVIGDVTTMSVEFAVPDAAMRPIRPGDVEDAAPRAVDKPIDLVAA